MTASLQEIMLVMPIGALNVYKDALPAEFSNPSLAETLRNYLSPQILNPFDNEVLFQSFLTATMDNLILGMAPKSLTDIRQQLMGKCKMLSNVVGAVGEALLACSLPDFASFMSDHGFADINAHSVYGGYLRHIEFQRSGAFDSLGAEFSAYLDTLSLSSQETQRFIKEIDFLFYFEMAGQAYLVVYEMKSSTGGFKYPNETLIDQIGKWQSLLQILGPFLDDRDIIPILCGIGMGFFNPLDLRGYLTSNTSPHFQELLGLDLLAKGQLLTTPAGDQIVFVPKNGKDAAGELQAMLEGVRSLSRTEANAEQIDAAQTLLTEYAFFSPEVTQKRLLSLISMGRPATNHAEPKNLERAIDFLIDNAADGLIPPCIHMMDYY